MAIKINDHFMCLDGTVIATERERTDVRGISYRPRFFGRNQAITALTVTEPLEQGHRNDDPVVMALREELR